MYRYMCAIYLYLYVHVSIIRYDAEFLIDNAFCRQFQKAKAHPRDIYIVRCLFRCSCCCYYYYYHSGSESEKRVIALFLSVSFLQSFFSALVLFEFACLHTYTYIHFLHRYWLVLLLLNFASTEPNLRPCAHAYIEVTQ